MDPYANGSNLGNYLRCFILHYYIESLLFLLRLDTLILIIFVNNIRNYLGIYVDHNYFINSAIDLATQWLSDEFKSAALTYKRCTRMSLSSKLEAQI